ncbi:MAG: hypothetical protein JRH20_28065 [Deltaproteobacteria bacterium]|nr:hypothetical protein [Deltaproteobacteria bacterium]
MVRVFPFIICGVLWLAGCLYLGGINHAPEGEVLLTTPATPPTRGEWVGFTVEDYDPDGESLQREWTISLNSLQHSDTPPCMLQSHDGICSSDLEAVVLSREKSVHFYLPAFAGSYRVEVRCRLTDPHGASTVAQSSLEVTNAAPKVNIVVTNGQEPSGGYARHEVLYLSVAGSSDEPGDLTCGSAASVRWERLEPSEASVSVWTVIPCRGDEVLDKLRVLLAPSKTPETLTLRATVKDHWGTKGSADFSLLVAGSQAPCVNAARPPFTVNGGATGAVVMPGVPLTLSVMGISPSSLEPRVLRWSSAVELEGPYEDLPHQPGAQLVIKADDVSPGTRRFYRVRVQEGLGVAAPRCATREALCSETELPSGCVRWVTWEVVGR